MLIRVLIIGRGAARWVGLLQECAGPALELDSARLPAEAIRRFEATPPDLLVIVDESGGARTAALIQAIQNRPLGRLLPIVMISAHPDGAFKAEELAAELGIAAWLPWDISPYEVLEELAVLLDLPQDELSREPLPGADTPATSSPAAPATRGDVEPAGRQPRQATHGGLIVEEILDERAVEPAGGADVSGMVDRFDPAAAPVEKVDRNSIFPVRQQQARPGDVTVELLRRKLREVRHEDYYTILEVRRGAETPVIKQAYMRLVARYEPSGLDFELAHRYYGEISEILDALEDAWAVLGDNTLRQQYSGAGR